VPNKYQGYLEEVQKCRDGTNINPTENKIIALEITKKTLQEDSVRYIKH
jgi:hypothetical protein